MPRPILADDAENSLGSFRSARERQLWRAACLWLLTIYSSLYFVQFILDFLRERNLLRASIALMGFTVAVLVLRWTRQQGAGPREWSVLAGVSVLYAVLLARTSIVQERIHFLQYGVLGVLFHAALRERSRAALIHGAATTGLSGRLAAPAAVVLTLLCGWLDEGIQALLPNRVYDLRDVALNAVAGAVAVAAVLGREWARQKDTADRRAAPGSAG